MEESAGTTGEVMEESASTNGMTGDSTPEGETFESTSTDEALDSPLTGGHHPPSIADALIDRGEATRVRSPVPDDHSFALCLTHDVDRPYETYQSLYYALADRDPSHLASALPGRNPYWQFDDIAALEADLGVRSAFYFLNEQHLLLDRPTSDWFDPTHWIEHLGRYDVDDVASTIRELDAGGWEVGLHGSYHSPDDRERLREEKRRLESILGGRVTGGRQHHLRMAVPATWHHHREIGLRYDASLGSGESVGFQYGYRPLRPFGDDFLVFPLTIMEQALPDPGTRFEAARDVCEDLLLEAARNDAVATALWHPRYFNEREFPGYRRLYRWLVERALELDAWVGPPRELYLRIERDRAASAVDAEDATDWFRTTASGSE
jgi:peptidoglycan/xylan/chitin deacetylase (PgdA/CDA1 family)